MHKAVIEQHCHKKCCAFLLTGLLSKIRPAVEEGEPTGGKHTSKDLAFVDKVAAVNVRRITEEMRSRSRVIRDQIEAGKLKIVGRMYNIATGRVIFFSHD